MGALRNEKALRIQPGAEIGGDRARRRGLLIAPPASQGLLSVLIEHGYRRCWPAVGTGCPLLRADPGVLAITEFGQEPGFEERLDQREHALVFDSGRVLEHPVATRNRLLCRVWSGWHMG
jgi:hypothetical protein